MVCYLWAFKVVNFMSNLLAGPAVQPFYSEGNELGCLLLVSSYCYMCPLLTQGCKDLIPFTLQTGPAMYGQITLLSETHSSPSHAIVQ